MRKAKNRDKVIQLFEDSIRENEPYGYVFSFREILDHSGIEYEKPYQSIAKLLKRLEKDFVIVYFRLKAPRMDTKDILREIYFQKKWPENSGRVYVYTPMSAKTYKRLMRRYKDKNKNKELIREICNLYSQMEMASKFQYMYATKSKFISKEGKKYMKEDIDKLYKERGNRIKINLAFHGKYFTQEQKQYYEEKWQRFLKKNLILDKYMYWATFYQNKKHKHYDYQKSSLKNILEPMYGKLMCLFAKITTNSELKKNI